jgi:hypothetical protein
MNSEGVSDRMGQGEMRRKGEERREKGKSRSSASSSNIH